MVHLNRRLSTCWIVLLAGMISLLSVDCAIAQVKTDQPKPLKFDFSPAKRLDENDLSQKKEGRDTVLLPQAGFDRQSGLSLGLIGALYFNGSKRDSLFYYSDYRFRLDFAAGASYRSRQSGIFGGDKEFGIGFDAPYIWHSRYRLRGKLNIESNPNRNYFAGLPPGREDPELWHSIEHQFEATLERMMCRGVLWPYVGLAYSHLSSTGEPGSFLADDASSGKTTAIGNTRFLSSRAGLRFDNRDHPDDPSTGWVAESAYQFSHSLMGTPDYQQLFCHINGYFNVRSQGANTDTAAHRFHFRSNRHAVIAFRLGVGATFGQAPFYAYQRYWTGEDDIDVLGGDYTLRGEPEARYTGKVISFANLEYRIGITTASYIRNTKASHFYQLAAVPFVDWGSYWQAIGSAQPLQGNAVSGGLGLRVTVNGQYVIRGDQGFSANGSFFILQIGQNF